MADDTSSTGNMDGDDPAGGDGGRRTDVPKESPSSEDDLALDNQAARIHADDEKKA